MKKPQKCIKCVIKRIIRGERFMKLLFIGTGSAFTVGCGNYQSNILLQSNSHKNLLIDCGSDARLSLHEQGFSYKDIHDVYVSHLHADHIGGLEWLAFATKFDPNCTKPYLHISDRLVDDLWNNALCAGLVSLPDASINLSSFFQVNAIKNETFIWEEVLFHLFQTFHVILHQTVMPSYGLFFEVDKKNVLITTDTKFFPSYMNPLYEKADIIFHDCDTNATKNEVHAHYTELNTLDLSIKKKMWLYHYPPGPLPDAKKDGFKGFVHKGQCFDLKNDNSFS
jgi:ribonuclease BN (tRNA processing enzyme)